MTEQSIAIQTINLEEIFPSKASADTRPGYEGYIIAKEDIIQILETLKTEHGYDLFSSVTAVDLFPDDRRHIGCELI